MQLFIMLLIMLLIKTSVMQVFIKDFLISPFALLAHS